VSGLLEHLGRAAARYRWMFVVAWIVAAVAVVALAAGLDGADVEPAISASVANLEKLPHVVNVSDPYGPLGPAIISKDGRITLVTVQFDVVAQKLPKDIYQQLVDATAPAAKAGARIEYGGAVVDYAHQPPEGNADLIGLLAAVIVLLFAFGSVVAMGLPITTAVFGLVVGMAAIEVVSAFTDIGTLAPTLGKMIGLGVGIDYSLFIVTRYRENRAQGMDIESAIARSVGTAGAAVLFAGTTVVIAICGLAVSGIPYVARLGYMSGLVVLVMMTAALTLLPAVLAIVGDHIDKWKVPSLMHHADRAAKAGHPDPVSPRSTVWERWAETVARHAWPFAALSVAILLMLAWPVLSMRLGESDDGNLPSNATQRQAFDLVAQGFGAGANGPLLVVVSLPEPGDSTVADSIAAAIEKTPGVAEVAPPELSPNGKVAQIAVVPTSAPDSEQTQNLVATLRGSVLPAAVGTSGARAYVGGLTATFIDIGDRISTRLPYFIAAVVLLSFLLLMLVFHSVLVPLTAAVMNLLSVAAAYGVTVAVFQWGWFKGLVGLQQTVPITAFVPMMMFAVLFGLSMDYQVFLLTRIREEYDKTGDTRLGVVRGLARTARVITSAALIMIFVFGAFVMSPTPEVKMFGLGLAVAVLVDATIVRMMLVPATMEILGDANWWFPKWLSFLPRIDIDGAEPPHTDEPEARPEPEPEPVPAGV
jgi:RND superfamily putative drug exporter